MKHYFVGNAHIDPVWMWPWQEGSAEAKATLRSALDRMNEYPEFIFVCSASCIFEWIEEFDPDMFRELQMRVKEGRLRLVGGWYVQPDCNLPCGESFARHGLYGQRYFKEKFGVTAKTGYNVDSFGHCLSIPMLLRGAGMEQYLFMRPDKNELSLPSHAFRWASPDGSEVIACRIMGCYNTTHLDIDDDTVLADAISDMEQEANPDVPVFPFFYGVGNHGGGPTKKNIESIRRYREKNGAEQNHFSDTHDLFDELRRYYDKLPVYTDELQHHASGCYATVTAVKEKIRRAENRLYVAEVFGHMANRLLSKPLPDRKELERGWKNVLFAQFHDSFGGCCLQSVHQDTENSLGESISIAQRIENNALQAVSWKIDHSDSEKGFPLVLFNPHPYAVTETIRINKRLPNVFDALGKELPMQIVQSPTSLTRLKRGDTLFRTEIPAMGYTTCYYREGTEPSFFSSSLSVSENSMENEYLRGVFDPETGFLSGIVDKKTGKNVLRGFGGIPVILDEEKHDTWSHRKNVFEDELGPMTGTGLKILEDGPIRVSMVSRFTFGRSTLNLYYSLDQGSRYLEIQGKLFWAETQKMLKLRFDTVLDSPDVFFEIPFGTVKRPANGEEEPGQTWLMARDAESGFAMLNNNRYSFSVQDGSINLTAIRSPYYLDHRNWPDTDKTDFAVTEQGEHVFSLAVRPLDGREDTAQIIRDAHSFNLPCSIVPETNHPGFLPEQDSLLQIDRGNVLLSALKESEDGGETVLRLWETVGEGCAAHITGKLLPAPLTAFFPPRSVKTFLYRDGKWHETDFTELKTEVLK